MKMKNNNKRRIQDGFQSVLGLVTSHTLRTTLFWCGVLTLIQMLLFLNLGIKQGHLYHQSSEEAELGIG